MEAAGEAKSIMEKIMPPRLEDAGLEDCALPPDSIREAFMRAASAVRSIVSDSGDEGGGCVEDPWEDSSDALVGVTNGVDAPSDGCTVEKGTGSTEAAGDRVVVVAGGGDAADAVVLGGLPEGGEKACVDGFQGLEIEGNGRGILGKKDDVADEEEKGDDEQQEPILAETYV